MSKRGPEVHIDGPPKSYRRSWRSASPLTKLQLFLTSIITFATVLYCFFSGWTLYEIRSGGEDTHRLAEAAGKSAEAAKEQADAVSEQVGAMRAQLKVMQDQAETMTRSLQLTDRAVTASERQAMSSHLSAEMARESARISSRAMIIQAQPYIGNAIKIQSFEAGRPLVVELSFINEGNSPATLIRGEYKVLLRAEPEAPQDYSGSTALTRFSILPHKVQPTKVITPLDEESFNKIKGEQRYLFIFGRGSYEAIGGEISFEFCYVYFNRINGFGQCADIANLDKRGK